MLELTQEGLYIANGKETSVLIKVVGKAPMLDIACGVLLNDMQTKNKVTILSKDSLEIQDILNNPKSYVYDLPSVSEAVNNKYGLEREHMKYAEYTETKLLKWVEKYKKLQMAYPDEYVNKMIVVLVHENFSVSQARLVIDKIEARIKVERARML